MSSLIDALDGIVGIEPEPDLQPPADQHEPQPSEMDAITISESEAKSEPEPQPVPESTTTPAEAITVSEPHPRPEPNAIAETIGSLTMSQSEIQSDPQSNVVQDADSSGETQLAAEITDLWGQHTQLSRTRKTTARELRLVSARLGEKLYRMKSLLSRPGRGGEWRGWLKQQGIARSSADRWVSRYAESLSNENEKLPSGAISKPAEADIEKLARNTWQRIGKFLTTNESAFEFISRFTELAGVRHERRDEGLVILKPSTQAVEETIIPTPELSPVPESSDGSLSSPEQPIVGPNTLPPAEQSVSTVETSSAVAV